MSLACLRPGEGPCTGAGGGCFKELFTHRLSLGPTLLSVLTLEPVLCRATSLHAIGPLPADNIPVAGSIPGACVAAAVPTLLRTWRPRAPSTHPRASTSLPAPVKGFSLKLV